MKVLIIDTSTSFLYINFYDEKENKQIYFKSMISHNNHSENIINVIEEGLNNTNMKLMDFDKVVVGMGPGSYTGLRIGMVVAKMTAYCCKIPLYIVSSLSFCGSGYLLNDGVYAIYNKAKKDYCYTKVVEVKNGVIKIVVDDEFITDDQYTDLVKEYKATIINEDNYLINEKIIISLSKEVKDIHTLVPNYLRKANS